MSKIIKTQVLACIGLLLLMSWGHAQEVSIKVTDPLNEVPLSGVSVDIDARVIVTDTNGEQEMLSIEELDELNITGTTDNTGTFRTKVPVEGSGLYITAKVSKAGYETMINMATEVTKTGTATIVIEMLPDADGLAPSATGKSELQQRLDDFVWERKLDLEKKKIESNYDFKPESNGIKPKTEDKNAKSSQAAAGCDSSFDVPSKVYVKGLITGYPQPCGSSSRGFTGNINFDDYIAGVIDAELGPSFPLEALKAQSVASRTFALNNREEGRPANCGHAYKNNISEKSIKAANATTGVVVLYNNNAIHAFYSARCHGDYTRPASIESCALGTPSGAAAYCVSVACSGHTNCRNTSEPCCTKFNPKRNRNETVYGHGVGMCQRGVQGFAESGWGWERMITHFYRNITLSCPPNSCTRDLKLTGTIKSGTYKSSRSITATGSVGSGKRVVFDAPNQITLNPGFRAVSGSTFTAKIGSGCSSKSSLSDTSLVAAMKEPSEGASNSIDNQIKLYPNPASDFTVIDFKEVGHNNISYELRDIFGKKVGGASYDPDTSRGLPEIKVFTADIPTGLYLCVINVAGETTTKKLQVSR